MTVVVKEILKQVAVLPVEQQRELAMQLLEQAQRQADSPAENGHYRAENDAAPLSPIINDDLSEAEPGDDWLDTLDLKLMPPKRSYTLRVRYELAGRLEPLPYDFGDFFDDEEGGEP